MLNGKSIYLRALEPNDISFLYALENDISLWEYSHTQTPYSKYILQNYLENSHQDIYQAKQLRLVIAQKATQKTLGFIDLFDFDPKNHRAGLGIAILTTEDKNKGYGTEAVALMLQYCKDFLQLHQLFVNISTENEVSKKLFSSFGFQKIGLKKEWNFYKGKYSDEEMYQKIL
jgi:diamine N-acetyltransferase